VRPNLSAEQERIAYLEKKFQTKHEVLAEPISEHVAKKTASGTLTGDSRVPHDSRARSILDFVKRVGVTEGPFLRKIRDRTSKIGLQAWIILSHQRAGLVPSLGVRGVFFRRADPVGPASQYFIFAVHAQDDPQDLLMRVTQKVMEAVNGLPKICLHPDHRSG
jgi:hypothetical protein